jgi:hypothetical protein
MGVFQLQDESHEEYMPAMRQTPFGLGVDFDGIV